MRYGIALFLVPALALQGCLNTSSTTDVKADGTATYSVKLTAPDPEASGGMVPSAPIEQLYALPKEAAWKTTQTTDKEKGVVFTATRSLNPGQETDGGITLLEKDQPLTKTTVKTEKLPNGNVRYTAVFSWVGPKEDLIGTSREPVAKEVQAMLPTGTATDEQAVEIAETVARDLWKALFGPGDPLFAQMMTNPEMLERKLKSRMAGSINRTLVAVLGNKLTDAQRKAVVAKALESESVKGGKMVNPQAQAQKQGEDSVGGFASMVFSVKMPGTLVSHNGALDEYTGEVYWDLFSPAPQIGPVTMTAESKP